MHTHTHTYTHYTHKFTRTTTLLTSMKVIYFFYANELRHGLRKELLNEVRCPSTHTYEHTNSRIHKHTYPHIMT